MTSRERLEAALHNQPHDRTPWSPFLAYWWEAQPKAVQERGMLAMYREMGCDPLWRGAPGPIQPVFPESMQIRETRENGRVVQRIETPVGTLRQAYATSASGGTDFLIEHSLKTEEDYKIQMWIEENTVYRLDETEIRKHLDGPGSEGLSLFMLFPIYNKTAFQALVEHLVGTEELIYALSDFPETVEALVEVIRRRQLEVVRLIAQTDYKYWITWEDSSTQNYSPMWYETYIEPQIAEWTAELAKSGKHYIQHACGHIRDLLPAIKRQQIFALESISPPPTGNIEVADVRRQVGPDLPLIGGIEPVFFKNCTEVQLDERVEHLLEVNRGCPYVLSNSDSCPPQVELWKFKRVAERVRMQR